MAGDASRVAPRLKTSQSLDPLQLRLEECQLHIGNCRATCRSPLEITPGSSSALLNSPTMRTNGASSAKYTPGCVIAVRCSEDRLLRHGRRGGAEVSLESVERGLPRRGGRKHERIVVARDREDRARIVRDTARRTGRSSISTRRSCRRRRRGGTGTRASPADPRDEVQHQQVRHGDFLRVLGGIARSGVARAVKHILPASVIALTTAAPFAPNASASG